MAFGSGADLAAQCPPSVPPPTGWIPWTDADGPVPADLVQRAQALATDNSIALGSTASYPLPGVTVLIRVEAQTWNRDTSGNLVEGCFRVGALYVPDPANPGGAVAPPSTSEDSWTRTATILTVVSLGAGILATLFSWGRK